MRAAASQSGARRAAVAGVITACTLAMGAATIPGTTTALAGTRDIPSDAPCSDHDRIEDRYIVTMRPEATVVHRDALIASIEGLGGDVYSTYRLTFRGFAVELDDSNGLDTLGNHPLVSRIDAEFVTCVDSFDEAPPESTSGESWGLDRIDQRQLPLDGLPFTSPGPFLGDEVRVFVIDSGIRHDHVELANVELPTDLPRLGRNFVPGVGPNNTNDCDGHGTHVAGTIGSTNYGVAPGVRLIPIRVFDCAGAAAVSVVLNGIEWVAAQVVGQPRVPTVVNMSFEGDGAELPDSVLNVAVAGLIDIDAQGIPVVISAGNFDPLAGEDGDACNITPANVRRAITVGATTNKDERWANSAFGNCIDIFAPGVGILSTSWRHASGGAPGPRDQLEVRTGTSMAAPHVTGLVAHYLQKCTLAQPFDVETFLEANATASQLEDVTEDWPVDSPNMLAYAAARPAMCP